MQQKKSKGIFWIFSILAVVFLTFILLIATFGVGFSVKKKYRKNNWL
ncbi:MAG: hypothetical protein E7A30_12245 [Staphylococcus sp.]|nr:hypothetical protein [Staphylococcus sp.]